MSVPPSPPAVRRSRPAWLNLRLLVGVFLVLVSVVVGARIVGTADRTVRVWAVANDLSAGTVLTAADLVPVRVRLLGAGGRYLAAEPAGRAAASAVGRTLGRSVGAGELLPRAALTSRGCGGEVSIPVAPRHIPVSVRHGSRVDVFATVRRTDGSAAPATGRVLAAVAVQAVTRPNSGLVSTAGEWAVVVRVTAGLALDVVRAVRTADIDVVLVRPGDPLDAGDGCGHGGTPSAGPAASDPAASDPPAGTGAPSWPAGSPAPSATADGPLPSREAR